MLNGQSEDEGSGHPQGLLGAKDISLSFLLALEHG